jgi:hypothetical protein
MNTNSDRNIISKVEIEESFFLNNRPLLENIFYNMKERCDMSAIGVLEKQNVNTMSDFHDLIKNNVDLVGAYKKNYKI